MLDPAAKDVLRAAFHPRPQTDQELADTTDQPLDAITTALVILEEAGFIERYGEPIPGVRATDAGIAELKRKATP